MRAGANGQGSGLPVHITVNLELLNTVQAKLKSVITTTINVVVRSRGLPPKTEHTGPLNCRLDPAILDRIHSGEEIIRPQREQAIVGDVGVQLPASCASQSPLEVRRVERLGQFRK